MKVLSSLTFLRILVSILWKIFKCNIVIKGYQGRIDKIFSKIRCQRNDDLTKFGISYSSCNKIC